MAIELADKTMDPGYIQHNPNVPQGYDGFKPFMSRIPGRRPEDAKPIQAAWINPPALTLIADHFARFPRQRQTVMPARHRRSCETSHPRVRFDCRVPG